MLTTIARLFGKSPFSPLQSHMKKVSSCIDKLTEIFQHLATHSPEKLESLVAELSKLEHEADLTKNDIRNHLPRSLFLPIDRGQFLEILSIQDCLSDQAEDIGYLLILVPMATLGSFPHQLHRLFEKNIAAFWNAQKIIVDIHQLLESSFGGLEAEKVKSLAEKIAYAEYEADKMKHQLMKDLFSQQGELSAPAFYLSSRLIEEVNRLSHISEKLANRIRMILELK